MNTPHPDVPLELALAYIDRAAAVASDLGVDLRAEMAVAELEPLDEATAERLYTRLLMLAERAQGNDDDDVAERVRAEVSAILASVPRPPAESLAKGHEDFPQGRVRLQAHNGLSVRDVKPTPVFNGKTVEMREGYVDVTLLDPWEGNARAQLYVDEFESKFGRAPAPDELLKILTGDISLGDGERDPFRLRPLASSIARKGVEKPPIITADGVPYDGNRRIAASRLVLMSDQYSDEEKDRARWIKVWQTGEVTEDQLEAVVVALNFEVDLKEPWPEYVKARMVVERFQTLREQTTKPVLSVASLNKMKDEVAKHYAIGRAEVTRYLEMVKWADDFMDYQIEAGKDRAEVVHRTDSIFQWFYEIQAGRAGSKVTDQFEADPEIRSLLYDLMYDATFDSGAQVRAMHLVAADPEAYRQLIDAHQMRETRRDEAQELVKDAINDARQRARAKKGVTLEEFAKQMSKRLGETPAGSWEVLGTEVLVEVRRALLGALGAINGELSIRGDAHVPAEVD